MTKATRDAVQNAIRELLLEQGSFQSSDLSRLTGLSRQALNQHLRRALEGGSLVCEGGGRSTRYVAGSSDRFSRDYEFEGLGEERVSAELGAWLASREPTRSEAAASILAATVGELVHNAIEHSGAARVLVRAELVGERLRIEIEDAGLGALENLRSRLRLEDHLHALGELSRGATTTRPECPSGGGLFLSSRVVERFRLSSNGLAWVVDNELGDQTVEAAEAIPGTCVELEFSMQAVRTPAEAFGRTTRDLGLDTTRCVVRLFEQGSSFLSRSEAERLVANLERFRVVRLDFHGVRSVGQGFVDEVFRVWSRAHPGVQLLPVAMCREVEFMVRRGLARAAEIEGQASPGGFGSEPGRNAPGE